VTIALSVGYVNIVSSLTKTDAGVARMHFEFEIASSDHLDVVVRTLRAIGGVYDVILTMPGV
jgi:(p)ppGpp synthase/HD superfamily hydrolase